MEAPEAERDTRLEGDAVTLLYVGVEKWLHSTGQFLELPERHHLDVPRHLSQQLLVPVF